MADSVQPNTPTVSTAAESAPTQTEPSGPISRLRHDPGELEALERQRHTKKNHPVWFAILGLTALTAAVFYGLHLRAVAVQRAAAERRAAQVPPGTPTIPAKDQAEAKAVGPRSPASTDPQAALPPKVSADLKETPKVSGDLKPSTPPTASAVTSTKAEAEAPPPAASPRKAAKPKDAASHPAKKDDKVKALPRLPVLPEG